MRACLVILMSFSMFLLGCGIECINPICPSPGASENASSSPPLVSKPFGDSLEDVGFAEASLVFSDNQGFFLFSYPQSSWTVTESSSEVMLTNSQGENSSSIELVLDANPSTDSLEDIATSRYPDLLFGTFETDNVSGLIATVSESNNVTVFRALIQEAAGDSLIDAVIVRKSFADGEKEVNFIMQTLKFIQ